MANVDNPNGFKCVKSDTGIIQIEEGLVATGQTITKGDALIITSGLIQIAVATSPQLYGIAAESVTSAAAGSNIKFIPALPIYVFEGQTSGTYAATDRADLCDIEGATGVMEVNEDGATEDVIVIIREHPDASLAANARVYFRIVQSSYLPLNAALA
jgi:hypothetical protein|tara:strand:+ start:133 stop:603 length:471 start_codon:yes stop_codon:yes gene_type:complete